MHSISRNLAQPHFAHDIFFDAGRLKMLHVTSAVSGESITTLTLDDLEVQCTRALKQRLAELTGLPQFRQRLLRADHSECLDEEPLVAGELQLVFLQFLAQDDVETMKLLDACQQNDVSTVELFLLCPRKPQDGDNFAEGARSGSVGCASLLVEAVADINDASRNTSATPLHLAVEHERLEMIRWLLESGADKEAALHTGDTPLHLAARNMNAEVVRVLLEFGASPNAARHTDETPLHYAVRFSTPEVIRLLLESGAEHRPTEAGAFPLHLAITCGDHSAIEVVLRLLIESDADSNAARCDGETPLRLAVKCGDSDMVRFLIESGADQNAIGPDGATPLHLAVRFGCSEVVSFLLESVPGNGSRDESLLQVAARRRRSKVVAFLEKCPSLKRRRR